MTSESAALSMTGFSRGHLLKLRAVVNPRLQIVKDRGAVPGRIKKNTRHGRFRLGRPVGAHAEDRLLITLCQLHNWRPWNQVAFVTNRSSTSLKRDFNAVIHILNSCPDLDNCNWPDAAERRQLANLLSNDDPIYGTIGIIDGTLVKVECPDRANHSRRVASGTDVYWNVRRYT